MTMFSKSIDGGRETVVLVELAEHLVKLKPHLGQYLAFSPFIKVDPIGDPLGCCAVSSIQENSIRAEMSTHLRHGRRPGKNADLKVRFVDEKDAHESNINGNSGKVKGLQTEKATHRDNQAAEKNGPTSIIDKSEGYGYNTWTKPYFAAFSEHRLNIAKGCCAFFPCFYILVTALCCTAYTSKLFVPLDWTPMSVPSVGDYFHMAYNVITPFCLLKLLERSPRKISSTLAYLLVIMFVMGASIHLVGDSVNHRLVLLGVPTPPVGPGQPHHQTAQASCSDFDSPQAESFELLYMYDEVIGHVLWYTPFFASLFLYFMGCVKKTTSGKTEKPKITTRWCVLLVVSAVYYW
ncbi:hypothetical protein ScPMuIL_018451 [Solemya velum]